MQTVRGYNLLELIGSGGFGAVYRAAQQTIDREVAIKVILPKYANNPEFIRRFEIEAQVISRLEHLHIVPLYDFWRDSNGAYLVMRWLRGGNLKDAIQGGPLDISTTSKMIDQIGMALNSAHHQDIVHGDLKPANILLDEDGNAYLADFGIATDLLDSSTVHERADGNRVAGTLAYLAPEQLLGDQVSVQSDIYSLGLITFEALTGRHPFPGSTSVQHFYKHINDPLPDLGLKNLDLNTEINSVLREATSKNPRERYQSSLDYLSALRDAARLTESSDAIELVESLTRREQEILALIVDGKTNRQIAKLLFVEVSTVKWHITQLYKKLGVRSRVQATVRARELNLVVSPDDYEEGKDSATSISVLLPEPVNPYKGLRAFKAADYKEFFGRETLIQSFLDRFDGAEQTKAEQNGKERRGRFLAIVGPSGSGKSSLVKAGIIPALWSGKIPDSEKWFVVEMMPGPRPLDELEVALTRIAADQAGNLRSHLDRDRYGLFRTANLILPNDNSDLVVVIDQFEELFTLVEDESVRAHFMDLIEGAVTEKRSRVRVIVTLRADYYDRPLRHPRFGELVRTNMETLLPLSAEELERAIVNPANQVGVSFAPGLPATIIEDVSYRPGALPLLQYALTELFELRDGRLLTADSYEAIGGVTGALAKRAEELYQEQDQAGRKAIQQIFLRLVTISDPFEVSRLEDQVTLDTRRRVYRSELLSAASDQDLTDEIIDTYATYRLLLLDHHPVTRQPTVEVAHEAILREWDRLRIWLEGSLTDLSMHRQLGWITADWLESGKDESFYLRGSRLTKFESWLADTNLILTQEESEFLGSSLDSRVERAEIERDRHRKELLLERRARQRSKALVIVLAVALIIAIGLSITAVLFARQAENQRRLAFSRELVAAAYNNVSNDPELSIMLALHAAEVSRFDNGDLQPDLVSVLHQSVQADRIQMTLPIGGALAFSPDGKWLVVGNASGTLIAWDVTTGQIKREYDGHMAAISKILFTRDGRYLITSSEDTLVAIWDFESGQQLVSLLGHKEEVVDMDLSANGKYLVTVSADSLIQFWEMPDSISPGASISQLTSPTFQLQLNNFVSGIAYNADGSLLAILQPDTGITVLDTVKGEEVIMISQTTASASGISFSPDGKMLVGGFGDTGAMIWDAANGNEIYSLPDSAPVSDAVFSENGQIVALAAENGTWSLWNVSDGRLLYRLAGHARGINHVAISPTRSQLATSGMERTTKLWDISLQGSQELFTILAHGSQVYDAVYSPSGDQIASTSADGKVKLWDANSGALLMEAEGQSNWINYPTFSHSGSIVVATNQMGGASLWDVNTGNKLMKLQGGDAQYVAFGFDMKDATLIAGTGDGKIHVWDLDSQTYLPINTNHESPIIEIIVDPEDRSFWSLDYSGEGVFWDLKTGERLGDQFMRTTSLRDGEWNRNNQLVAIASEEGTASVSRLQHLRSQILWISKFDLRTHAGKVTGVGFSPDGTILATSGFDGTIRLWDMLEGEENLVLTAQSTSFFGVDISPDGRYLVAAGADGSIRAFVIDHKELLELARSRLNRDMTREECLRYLHVSSCPDF